MSVEIKKKKEDLKEAKVISFGKDSHRAVKGLKGSFFEGEIKVVHEVQAEKLVKAKLAEIVKADLVDVVTNNRTNVDAPTE